MSVTLLRMRRHVRVPAVRSMLYGNEFLRVRILLYWLARINSKQQP